MTIRLRRCGLSPLSDAADAAEAAAAGVATGLGIKQAVRFLELFRDSMTEQNKVPVMQALHALTDTHFGYFMHEWGPKRPGNANAIAEFRTWLRARQEEHKRRLTKAE